MIAEVNGGIRLEVGYDSSISSSFYQPFDVEQKYFVEPELIGNRSAENIFIDGDHVATARFVDLGGKIDLGWNASRTTQLRGRLLGQPSTDLNPDRAA